MAAVAALTLRTGGLILRFLQFAAAIIVLGIFSYFLAVQSKQGLFIEQWERAVEGLSGAAALYALFGVLLTCFLGGYAPFATVAIILDVLFVGAFVAITILCRGANQNCDNIPDETSLNFGSAQALGNPYTVSYAPSYYHACTLLKTCFALGIVGIILFLLSIPMQLAIAAHHRREKQLGNDTSTKAMFGRRNRRANANTPVVAEQRHRRGGMFGRRNRDVEAAPVGRTSYDTQTTYGNNAVHTNGLNEPKYGNNAVNY